MSARKSFLCTFLLILTILSFGITAYAADSEVTIARPSENGQLSVRAANLVDKDGNPVLLKGVSLHGITWFPDFVDNDLFIQVSHEWDANLMRIPVYPEEYIKDPETSMNLVRKGIQAAIDADMYVIVDWHVLEEMDPNVNADSAHVFLETIATEYANNPNIIYEICNEPNGETTWADVRDYAYETIPIIRKHCPDAVVLVGTPNYCKNLISAARNPLKIDNIMYVLHFYSSTHKDDLRREYSTAREMGMPIFVSECGISEASGTGEIDYDSAASWFSLLEDRNTSYAVWSLSNKNESSALFSPYYDPRLPFTEDDLSDAGRWVSELLKGTDPRSIPVPEGDTGLSLLSSLMLKILETEDVDVAKAWPRMALEVLLFITLCTIIILTASLYQKKHHKTYDDLFSKEEINSGTPLALRIAKSSVIVISVFFTTTYIMWRIFFSIPFKAGPLAVSGNILLLIVEVLGAIESLILYHDLMGVRTRTLPKIDDDEFPDVDIFIATYNEPVELLYKTINGCNHLLYPDKNKVHIWLCDDNRRPQMRKLAEDMNIGYFDRPDNEGAKAGNLNHAMGLTDSPYVVTLDADMIPKSDLLLKTIPYFVDAKKRNASLPEDKKIRLGLLQTPQCFYTPDVFQHALYSEKTAPNEQDFFYRTIEVAKTSSNSVIYGGSNTILSREALDAIGGFYTGSITEDFATGMLIESAGFVSLALPEPLASGMTPNTYKEHIQQRKRWGRGVISTAKKLHLFKQKGLSSMQKLSYMSSVIYWYSPIKNLIYIISPLMFACFAIPVFKCGWLDLVIYWLPMFLMQDIALRVFSNNAVSLKWSGIYETSVMPHLLLPVIKETFGITTSVFEVTDKSKKKSKSGTDIRSMTPFLVLIALCVLGIIRSLYVLGVTKAMGIVVLLFWLVRNTYFLIMSLFLVDGRDGDNEEVTVIDAEPVTLERIKDSNGRLLDGITTFMTVHSLKVYLDEAGDFRIGDRVKLTFALSESELMLECIITSIILPRHGDSCVVGLEIIDSEDVRDEYLQILYDRVPSLPQSLTRDYGILTHLIRNIAHRILR